MIEVFNERTYYQNGQLIPAREAAWHRMKRPEPAPWPIQSYRRTIHPVTRNS